MEVGRALWVGSIESCENQRTAKRMTFVVIRALLVLPEIKGSQFSQFVWSMNAKA